MRTWRVFQRLADTLLQHMAGAQLMGGVAYGSPEPPTRYDLSIAFYSAFVYWTIVNYLYIILNHVALFVLTTASVELSGS